MPISFNVDLTGRRKRQEAQLEREREQQAVEAMTNQFLGAPQAGPPTAGGLLSRFEGMIPAGAQSDLIETQLMSGVPGFQQAGLQSAQDLLEQERQRQVLEGITQQKPSLENLASLVGTPGFQAQALPSLVKSLTPPVAGADIDPVQSSNILPDGTVQLVRRSGAVEVKTPEQANVDKIKSAQRFGAELQGLRAGERGAGKAAIDASVEAFKGLTTARKTIESMDEGIRLLDEGADTGAVESRFPSIKAASVKLDNLQGRMGLNVIQNTTFGSLSEAELAFALSTALPQRLDAPALRQWMTEKRNAQDKLASYLEEAAVFLGTPGNTIADFLRQKRTAAFTQGAGLPSGGLPPINVPPPPPGFK